MTTKQTKNYLDVLADAGLDHEDIDNDNYAETDAERAEAANKRLAAAGVDARFETFTQPRLTELVREQFKGELPDAGYVVVCRDARYNGGRETLIGSPNGFIHKTERAAQDWAAWSGGNTDHRTLTVIYWGGVNE